MSDNELGFWFLVLFFGGIFVLVAGYAVACAIKWSLEHRVERVDARRRHELALEREKTKQVEAQRVRDERIWERAIEEHNP